MNYTFKAPQKKEWTVTDDTIIYRKFGKTKERLLSTITSVKHRPTNEKSAYGVVQIFHDDGIGFTTFSYPYSQRDDAFKAAEHIFRIVGGEEGAEKIKKQKNTYENGYKKRCNVCGHIFCYTLNDLKKNEELNKNVILNSLAGIGGALSGNYAAGATSNQTADDNLARIVDYNKCPHCGSTDLRDATEEELQQFKNKNMGTPALSAADELKKYKDLLDSGVITQEEFDTKKKQLLDL